MGPWHLVSAWGDKFISHKHEMCVVGFWSEAALQRSTQKYFDSTGGLVLGVLRILVCWGV